MSEFPPELRVKNQIYKKIKALTDSIKRVNLRESTSESIVKDEIDASAASKLISREITGSVDDIALLEFTKLQVMALSLCGKPLRRQSK